MTKDRLEWVISGLDFNDLTAWEEKFVESVEMQFKRSGYLTDRQEEMLERIFSEKGK